MSDPHPAAAVVVRPARPTDEVRRVVTEAFGDGGGVADLWDDVVSRGLARGSLVATGPDGGCVGHVGLSHGWLDTRDRLLDVLVLSPLSVVPAHQGAGVGAALLTAAVAEGGRLGAPLIVLEGDPGFYGRRGWRPAAEVGIAPASTRIPAPACQVVLLDGHEAWMTGRVVYRDVWWEHDAVGLRDPDLAAVEESLD